MHIFRQDKTMQISRANEIERYDLGHVYIIIIDGGHHISTSRLYSGTVKKPGFNRDIFIFLVFLSVYWIRSYLITLQY